MSSRYKAARLGALLLAVATTLLVAGPPALAATSGEYVGGVDGDSVRIGGHTNPVPTSLFRLKLDNDAEELLTYCVELDVDARLGATMIESEWAAYPDGSEAFAAQPDKVLWILHRSYPNTGLAELAAAIGVPALSEREAIAGTQAAIWHFSNDAKLDAGNLPNIQKLYDYLTGEANTGIGVQPPVSLALSPDMIADLDAGKNAGPFTLDSTAAVVRLTVEGPDGVQIVDSTGRAVEPLDKDIFANPDDKDIFANPDDKDIFGAPDDKDIFVVPDDKDIFGTPDDKDIFGAPDDKDIFGLPDDKDIFANPDDKDIFATSQFWLSPPTGGAAGSATVRATAQATVAMGRLFVGEDNDANPTQTLIVAASTPAQATAQAGASWIAAPPATTTNQPAPTSSQSVAPPSESSPQTPVSPVAQARAALPVTGASVLPLAALGAVLIGAGVGAMLLQRRLRRSH